MSTRDAKPAPELIGGVPVEWIAMLAELLQKEGRAFRASADGLSIEVQNLCTGNFERLALEKTCGGVTFATVDDRDAALRAIEARVYPVFCVEA